METKTSVGKLFARIKSNGAVVGAVVRCNLYNGDGMWFGRDYRIYTKQGYRSRITAIKVDEYLAAQGIVWNTDDLCNQTSIYWGQSPTDWEAQQAVTIELV